MMQVEGHQVKLGETPEARTSALGGKYMTFQLSAEDYGVEILKVREIIGLMEITRVPRVPDFVRGIINLRGRVIPVIDLRLKFGMAPCEATEQTVIIVVHCEVAGRPLTMGVLVDRVLEVLNIEGSQIEPPPDLGEVSVDGDFILGVGKAAHRVVFLLDIARVLSGAELAQVASAARSA
jgi:purine-binding chemotaxis protein CheW